MQHNGQDDHNPLIRDLCAAVENADDAVQGNQNVLGVMGDANKKYRLSIMRRNEAEAGNGDIVRLAELIHSGDPTFGTRQRMQIAFQLCLCVLQLCITPWIDESWTWEECYVLRMAEERLDEEGNEEGNEFPRLFVTQKFYSGQATGPANDRKRHPDTPLSILAGDPILNKLGFALIVLAFGKTLQEIREERPSRLGTDLENISPVELLDLVTARKLLKSGRIRDEAGVEYANVVKACIERQYVDLQDAIKNFRKSDDGSFFDCAEKAIMVPLYDHCKIFG
jgi:hypothetical protein